MPWNFSAFADEAGGQIDQQIQALHDAEMHFIDLRNVNGHSIVKLPEDEAKAIKAQLDEAGITVNMFGSPIGKIDIADDFQTDLDRLDHLAKMRDVFGCSAVRMFSYYNRKEEKPLDEFAKVAMDRLQQLKDKAGELGLVLFHENERHIYGDRLPEVLDISRLRDGKTFKMIYDFDNYNQSGDDCWENWDKLRNLTDAIHFKESNEKNEHVPMGTGAGQVHKILTDAVKIGWAGPVILEPHLSHSDAVMATGPSGASNQALKDMTDAECFQVAVDAAKKVMQDVGAKWA